MSESSSFLAWSLPLSYLLSAALTLATPSRRWGIAQLGALAGLLGISGAVAVALVNHEATHDGAGLAVALLIAGLGCFITRFSQRYLSGEAGQQRIEAPQAAIERGLAKHLQVRQLLEHERLHLFPLGDATVERRYMGAWSVWARADAA
jgi:hypothetical protein